MNDSDDDIEREAIEAEANDLDLDIEYIDYELPDWDSDEFWDEWGDEIDYEIFTVLS